MDMTVDTNEFQLGIIELLFQVVELVLNIVTGVLLPGVLTPLFSAIFGVFQTTA